METVKQGIAKPEKVLDGNDMNQDIGQLIGYVHSIGIDTGPKGVFPSEHFIELIETFMRKHRQVELRSPKRLANDAFQIKRLVDEHKYLQARYNEDKEKLNLHEYYKNLLQRLDDRGGVCRSDKSDALYSAEQIAHSMEMEAKAFMEKPESFDDIPDQWNTGSTLMQRDTQ